MIELVTDQSKMVWVSEWVFLSALAFSSQREINNALTVKILMEKEKM